MTKLINVHKVSELLGGMHIMTIYTMARTGKLPSVKIGRRVMFKEKDLIAWINRHRRK